MVRETSIKNTEIAEDFLEKRREASAVFLKKCRERRVLGTPTARVLKKIPVNKGGTRETGGTGGTGGTGIPILPIIPIIPIFPVFLVFPKSGRCQPLLFLCATKLRKVLCHFWWQKWRKSHAPHLWRRRESQSLKRMLRRQSVCRLSFLTALQLSPATTDKSVAFPPTMRSAGFRCALGARVLKKIPVNRGGRNDRSDRSDRSNRSNRKNRGV